MGQAVRERLELYAAARRGGVPRHAAGASQERRAMVLPLHAVVLSQGERDAGAGARDRKGVRGASVAGERGGRRHPRRRGAHPLALRGQRRLLRDGQDAAPAPGHAPKAPRNLGRAMRGSRPLGAAATAEESKRHDGARVPLGGQGRELEASAHGRHRRKHEGRPLPRGLHQTDAAARLRGAMGGRAQVHHLHHAAWQTVQGQQAARTQIPQGEHGI